MNKSVFDREKHLMWKSGLDYTLYYYSYFFLHFKNSNVEKDWVKSYNEWKDGIDEFKGFYKQYIIWDRVNILTNAEKAISLNEPDERCFDDVHHFLELFFCCKHLLLNWRDWINTNNTEAFIEWQMLWYVISSCEYNYFSDKDDFIEFLKNKIKDIVVTLRTFWKYTKEDMHDVIIKNVEELEGDYRYLYENILGKNWECLHKARVDLEELDTPFDVKNTAVKIEKKVDFSEKYNPGFSLDENYEKFKAEKIITDKNLFMNSVYNTPEVKEKIRIFDEAIMKYYTNTKTIKENIENLEKWGFKNISVSGLRAHTRRVRTLKRSRTVNSINVEQPGFCDFEKFFTSPTGKLEDTIFANANAPSFGSTLGVSENKITARSLFK